MAFAVIEQGIHLSPADRRRAAEAGPPDVVVRTSHPSLLASAGFVDVDTTDVTAGYRATMAAWHRATAAREVDVRGLLGDDEYADRQQRRVDALAAIDGGLLRRSIYVARRPSRRAD